jgi:hypothetical protein
LKVKDEYVASIKQETSLKEETSRALPKLRLAFNGLQGNNIPEDRSLQALKLLVQVSLHPEGCVTDHLDGGFFLPNEIRENYIFKRCNWTSAAVIEVSSF